MYTRLIYGLASAAQIFQHCSDVILQGIQKCFVYIDNIVIYGDTLEECIHFTMQVLARLKKHNVRLRLDKCKWFVNEI